MFLVIFVICLKIYLENWVMFFLEIENSLMINILIIFVLKYGFCIKKIWNWKVYNKCNFIWI